jgi:hypothetical protein
MLCGPCKAALKRARYVTVQQDIRRPSIIDTKRKRRQSRPAHPPAPPEVRARDARGITSNAVLFRRILVGLGVFAVLLSSASYFGQRELAARSHSDVSTVTAPVPDGRPEMAATDAKPAATVAPPRVEAVVPTPAVTAAVIEQASPPAKLVAAKRGGKPSAATFATADGDPPDAVFVPPEPEKPVPAPLPPPRPVPDRWQTMRAALTECDSQGMLDGLICGQRVRIQYCDGYWGKVAQCPGATALYER